MNRFSERLNKTDEKTLVLEFLFNSFMKEVPPYHIETRSNEWTGFYMIETSVMKKFIKLQTYSFLAEHLLATASEFF